MKLINVCNNEILMIIMSNVYSLICNEIMCVIINNNINESNNDNVK